MERRDLLRRNLDGGGLLSLAVLLSLHLAIAALTGIAVSPALGLTVLLVPLPTSAALFELAFRRQEAAVLRAGLPSAMAACWTIAVAQCALGVL